MIGQQIDEARRYGRYGRIEVLNRTGGICACCGKKLTERTMTIEHVIPLSRGGLDAPSNTIALCEECNRQKDNMLYFPTWFYSAIMGTPLIKQLNETFSEWFKTVKDEFRTDLYPLITPRANLTLMMLPPAKGHKNSRIRYIKDNIVQWHYTGRQYMDEVAEATGIDLWKMRSTIGSMLSEKNPPVAIYTCRKLTTEKILCMAAVAMDLSTRRCIISIEWSQLPKRWRSPIHFSLMQLYNDVMDLCGYRVDKLLYVMPETEENDREIDDTIMFKLPNMTSHSIKHVRMAKVHMHNEDTKQKYVGIEINTYTQKEKEELDQMLQSIIPASDKKRRQQQ